MEITIKTKSQDSARNIVNSFYEKKVEGWGILGYTNFVISYMYEDFSLHFPKFEMTSSDDIVKFETDWTDGDPVFMNMNTGDLLAAICTEFGDDIIDINIKFQQQCN